MDNTKNYMAEIWTEGKTDWQILKAAKERLEIDLNIKFHEFDDDMGDQTLLQRCQSFADRENPRPIIFIFDHDNHRVLRQILDETDKSIKNWGNNVYSLALPIPKSRCQMRGMSIEFYFSDEDICTEFDGKRLFLSSEFSERSGRLSSNPDVGIAHKGRVKGRTSKEKAIIISEDVYNSNEKNIALSKAKFARYIYSNHPATMNFDFSNFRLVFKLIQDIMEASATKNYPVLPDLNTHINYLSKLPQEQKIHGYVRFLERIIHLVLYLFCAIVIRYFEDNHSQNDEGKLHEIESIKKLLKKRFANPSYKTLLSLTNHCYSMISNNDTSSDYILELKNILSNVFILGNIGLILDDLEALFDMGTKARYADKGNLKRSIIEFLLPEFQEYFSLPGNILEEKIQSYLDRVNNNRAKKWGDINWNQAFSDLYKIFSPLTDVTLRSRKFDSKIYGDDYLVHEKIYKDNQIESKTYKIPDARWDDIKKINITEIVLDKNYSLFPFLALKDDALFFYKRTRARGYEFYSVSQNHSFIHPTRRKFDRSVFRLGSRQGLFWLDVAPVENPLTKIKANIPPQTTNFFIGRINAITNLKNDVLIIPNSNAIITGIGGMGKTALMIELTNKIFNGSKGYEEATFDNIIWVSAKRDYFHEGEGIERGEPEFSTFEQVLNIILEFFGKEEVEEYENDQKKEMLIELAYEESILLVVDNFETLNKVESKKIVKFFGRDLKRELRLKPQNFKIIITSRRTVDADFVNYKLGGLGPNEAVNFMDQLYKNYEHLGTSNLSNQQKNGLAEASKGIPIVIKHFYVRYFKTPDSFREIIKSLSRFGDDNELVKFSYSELLRELETQDSDRLLLFILLLLNHMNKPLLIRQMADILEIDTNDITKSLSTLMDYQCVIKIIDNDKEKFIVNHEIDLLVKSLSAKYPDIVSNLRKQIVENFSIEKQVDYDKNEYEIVKIFEQHVANNNNLAAEDFIKKEISSNPNSVFLNFHYAKFLRENSIDLEKSANILNRIRPISKNHLSIIRELFRCYQQMGIDFYEKADLYAKEIDDCITDDQFALRELGEFYSRWSSVLRSSEPKADELDEIKRQSKYKELAKRSQKYLNKIQEKDAEVFYLLSQSFYNLWEYKLAEEKIKAAIRYAEENENEAQVRSYNNFYKKIQFAKNKYRAKRKSRRY